MTFWFLLAGVISIIIAIPYFRFVFKRIKCACLIKKVCKKRKFRSFAVKPLWFFGCKYGKNCDVYIETPNEVYSVKLFGMKKRRSVLLLWEDGRYSVRNFIAVISFGTAIQYPIDSKAKDMSVFDFRYRFKEEWEIKTPHNILLVIPVSMEFRRKKPSGAESVIGDGETVNGMRVCSLPRLLRDLENAI